MLYWYRLADMIAAGVELFDVQGMMIIKQVFIRAGYIKRFRQGRLLVDITIYILCA